MSSDKTKESRSYIPIPKKNFSNIRKSAYQSHQRLCQSSLNISENSGNLREAKQNCSECKLSASKKNDCKSNVFINQLPSIDLSIVSSVSTASCPSINKVHLKNVSESDKNHQEFATKGDDLSAKPLPNVTNESKTRIGIYGNINKTRCNGAQHHSPQQQKHYQNGTTNYQCNNIASIAKLVEDFSSELGSDKGLMESCGSRKNEEIKKLKTDCTQKSSDSLIVCAQMVRENVITSSNTDEANSSSDKLVVSSEAFLVNQLIAKLQLNDYADCLNGSNYCEKLLERSDDCGPNISISPNVENKILRLVICHLRQELLQTKSTLESLTQELTINKETHQKSLAAVTIRAKQLSEELKDKESQINSLLIVNRDQKREFQELKQKITGIETQLEQQQQQSSTVASNNNYGHSRAGSSMSEMSCTSSCRDANDNNKTYANSLKWLKGGSISKAFRRRKKANSNPNLKQSFTLKNETEAIKELKNILRNKEMTITELRLNSLAASQRMVQLKDALDITKQETNCLKRDKDYLEKMAKLKVID